MTAQGDWRHRAACTGEDPELFFPVGTTGPAAQQTYRAQKVCARCPVRTECLRWAVDQGIGYGVWGGLGEDRRRSMKRRAARARSLLREP